MVNFLFLDGHFQSLHGFVGIICTILVLFVQPVLGLPDPGLRRRERKVQLDRHNYWGKWILGLLYLNIGFGVYTWGWKGCKWIQMISIGLVFIWSLVFIIFEVQLRRIRRYNREINR